MLIILEYSQTTSLLDEEIFPDLLNLKEGFVTHFMAHSAGICAVIRVLLTHQLAKEKASKRPPSVSPSFLPLHSLPSSASLILPDGVGRTTQSKRKKVEEGGVRRRRKMQMKEESCG